MFSEGPEVKTLVDQLQPAVGMRLVDIRFLSGRYVRSDRPKGFAEFANTITPTEKGDNSSSDTDTITALSCKGKFIYMILSSKTGDDDVVDDDYQRSIWITLGMTGQFVNDQAKTKPVASNSAKSSSGPRWYMELMDTQTKETRKVYYRDTRNFGTLRFSLSVKELNDKLDSLGPDMLAETSTEDIFLAAMKKSTQKRNICKFLMDQSKISGVGNYILAEGLYRARLDPFAEISEINIMQRKRLFKELREVIATSYQNQGLTRPDGGTFRNVDGERGQFEFQLQAYGQRLTPNKFPVTKEVNGPHGRTIWYSEEEQLFMPRNERKTKEGDEKKPTLSAESTYVFAQIPNQLRDEGWKKVLADHMESESFQSLLNKIQTDANAGATIYPPPDYVFQALNLCPLENVKVVIVGQVSSFYIIAMLIYI